MDKSKLISSLVFQASVSAEFELYGMLAENDSRKAEGDPQAYSETDFINANAAFETRVNELLKVEDLIEGDNDG